MCARGAAHVPHHKTLWHAPSQTNAALKVSLVFYAARAVRTLRLVFFFFLGGIFALLLLH